MKKMLIVCDVEGTIFQAKYKIEGTDYASSMWQPIAQALGEKAIKEEYETHLKWENYEYDNYVDWVKATVAIHKKYKLNRETFQRLIDNAEYMPGVVEFFKKIDREKFIPVLITGGFRNLARRARKELDIESSNIFAACNYIFDDDGNLIDEDIQPSDFEDKIACVKTVLDNYRLDFNDDWVFIGDGKNDVPIAEMAPYSFAINAHDKLRAVADQSIDDFMDAFNDIETFYEMVNSEKGSKDYQKKILERAALRQSQREKIVKDNLELRETIETLKKRIVLLENDCPVPLTVKEIIPFAEHYFGENIYFSNKAENSLLENSKSGYKKKHIESIYKHIQYINIWAQKMKNEISDREYENLVGDKISIAISESTGNMFNDDYKDNGVMANMHLYMPALPNCDRPRIYFGWDKKRNKAIISTMCEHKKTSKFK